MKSLLIILLTFSTLTAYANLERTAWKGKSELFLNGELHCSSEKEKNPKILSPYDSYLTLHVSHSKWIWPKITKGCALGWFWDYMALNIEGNKLFHQNGILIGTITNNTLEAFNFSPKNERVFINSLKLHSTDFETIEITVVFEHIEKNGEFVFKSTMKRHRDSVWP